MVARLRGQNPAQVYGENTNQFTIAWHYGGRFFVKPNNVKYKHGKVEYIDYADVDDFKKLTVDMVAMFMRYLGYKLPVGVLYKRKRMSLLNELVRIKNMEDVKIMLDGVNSTVALERNEQEFKRLYVCLAACKVGFLGGYRKVIGLHGCFLKSEYGGQLLSTVGIDGNNAMFPIAYVVVDTENEKNWTWFLSLLRCDLHISNPFQWTFISDKQKGLMQAVRTLFEESEHKTYVRHLYKNFKLIHKGMLLKHTLWNAVRATNVPMWQKEMEVLKELNTEAFEWLAAKPVHQWSRSYFRESQKCDILLNNLFEAFNSSIVNAWEKPILAMLEQIRFNLMIRMVNKKEEPAKWKTNVGPRIEKVIDKHRKSLRYESITVKFFPVHIIMSFESITAQHFLLNIGIFMQLTLEIKDLKSGTSTMVTSIQWTSWRKHALVGVGNSLECHVGT
ncbi:Uncharacterized protein Adt_05356 [Abeliophyllum distichum]|uniref:MULE transposase domain-containing protein n=1 Tax=Abeliophyllum distichum TaxID=126358 RepID=A0ABD1V3U8_9LAMI